MPQIINIDDQPIETTFFGEGKWLTEFITPDNLEVQELYYNITRNVKTMEERLATAHLWVGSLRYKKFIKGRLWIEGKASVQNDLWNPPSITARIKVGNCANKSFLLTSLFRQELAPGQVSCVLGNLYNGKPGGHAWVQVNFEGQDYIVESTRPDIPAFVPVTSAKRYEAVHFFDDKTVQAVEGRTVLEPFTACYSTWLKDYLDWTYIEGSK